MHVASLLLRLRHVCRGWCELSALYPSVADSARGKGRDSGGLSVSLIAEMRDYRLGVIGPGKGRMPCLDA